MKLIRTVETAKVSTYKLLGGQTDSTTTVEAFIFIFLAVVVLAVVVVVAVLAVLAASVVLVVLVAVAVVVFDCRMSIDFQKSYSRFYVY